MTPKTKKAKLPYPYLRNEHGLQWDLGCCDVELVVGGKVLLTHKCFLATYSKILKECISTSTADPAAHIQCIRIPLEDDVEQVEDLLQLMYAGASDSSLWHLLSLPEDRCHAVIRLADKYNMTVLTKRISQHICASSSRPWSTVQGAISWAALSISIDLPGILSKCEKFIAANAKPDDLSTVAASLSMASALRILQKILQSMDSPQSSSLSGIKDSVSSDWLSQARRQQQLYEQTARNANGQQTNIQTKIALAAELCRQLQAVTQQP